MRGMEGMKRPLAVTLIGRLFIVAGAHGFVRHVMERGDGSVVNRDGADGSTGGGGRSVFGDAVVIGYVLRRPSASEYFRSVET